MNIFLCITMPAISRHDSIRHCLLLGGDAEMQTLARVARNDADASCRATAIAAMVAIRSLIVAAGFLIWCRLDWIARNPCEE